MCIPIPLKNIANLKRKLSAKRKIFREFIEGEKQNHEEMSETRKHRVEAAKASLHESRVMNESLKKEFNEMTIKLRQALEEEKTFQEHLKTVCKEENEVESRLTEIREQARQLEVKEKAFDLYDKHVGASVVNIRKDCICLLQRANELLESDKLTQKLAQFEAAAVQT